MSNPAPPSIETGAFRLYSMKSLPAPPKSALVAATELAPLGIATPLPFVRIVPSEFVSASANARTTNRSLPSFPSRRSAAWLL